MAKEKESKSADTQLKALMALPANRVCADCGASKPRFASITLAVFLCNRCYGIHRGVGAHVTRTKCVGLDRWSLEDVRRMQCIGNAAASAYWEQNVPAAYQRPDADSQDTAVESWIRDKYERKLFCPRDIPPPSVAPLPPIQAKAAIANSGDSSSLTIPGPSHQSSWDPFGQNSQS